MEERRFKLPKIEIPRSPLTNQGVKALIIVLAVIFLISAIVYLNIARQRKEISPVLPATTTQEEIITEPEPTELPTVVPTEEPIPTPTPEETPIVTISPTATESTATESTPTD